MAVKKNIQDEPRSGRPSTSVKEMDVATACKRF